MAIYYLTMEPSTDTPVWKQSGTFTVSDKILNEPPGTDVPAWIGTLSADMLTIESTNDVLEWI